ncbi:hypothetical protein BU15DRAFT_62297 [Melanogaster broomeanus]|nr:hypothetical protein BU15DRAFT_62297 [Melanogaster broomeanus]
MVHGRVIGNELRDVPPERISTKDLPRGFKLPVWGQRWLRPRRALGPSRYFVHTFHANGMTEAAPMLTSPAQFEMTITGEDDDDDDDEEYSLSSQLLSPFPLSSSQTYLTEPIPFDSEFSSLQTPNALVYHNHSAPATPSSSRWANTRHPNSMSFASQNAVHPSPMLLQRRHSEQLPTLRNNPRSLMPPPAQHSTMPTRSFHVSPEYDYALGHIGFPSTSMQHHSNPSYMNQLPHGRPQSPQVVSQQHASLQAPTVHGQASAQFFQSNASPHSDSEYFLQLLQADDQPAYMPTPRTSAPHNFTLTSPQHNVGSGSSWNNHDSIPAVEQPPVPGSVLRIPPESTTSGWPLGSIHSYPTFPEVFLTQATGSSPPTPEDFRNIFSDRYGNPSPLEEQLSTFTYSHVEESVLFDSRPSPHRMIG